jgi:spermidine/putrescine-binding protein
VRLFANAENVRDSGSAPADDVGGAQAVACIVIDFYGRKEILRAGEPIVGFVIPEGGSITDPDPIAMLKGAPHPELAAHFIEFVISEEGQKLWTLRVGTPGGPRQYVLGRLSVLPELYEKYGTFMFDSRSPFASAQPLKADNAASNARRAYIGELIKTALIENRRELVAARRAVRDAGDPPELLAKMEMLPSFIPTRVVEGKLVDDAARPIGKDDLKAVAQEFKPSDKVKAENVERLQRRLEDLWKGEFLARFEAVRREAEAGRK